jgi:hypothetical protein
MALLQTLGGLAELLILDENAGLCGEDGDLFGERFWKANLACRLRIM